jgi:NOL1/NOP2/fmu family ribosome biogenesis protein
MNLLENEWVLDTLEKKYPETFRITYQKRFWPHIDGTWGFYVAKLLKLKSIETREKTRPEIANNEITELQHNDIENQLNPGIKLYNHEGKILALIDSPHLENIREKYYFMRFWEKIGQKEKWQTFLEPFAHRYIDISHFQGYEIENENDLDAYLRGNPLVIKKDTDSPILLKYQGIIIAIEEINNGVISNNFPHDWRRK